MGQVPSDLIHRVQDEFFDSSTTSTPPNQDGACPKRSVSALRLVREGINDLPAIWDAVQNSSDVGLDDRKLLLENALTLMAQTNGHPLSQQLSSFVTDFLYKDLPHPPGGYVTTRRDPAIHNEHGDIQYAYRTADGSNYNVLMPTLGMARTPYARSVPNTHPLPSSFLPDAGLVFDTLLKRQSDGYVEHPGGLSSLFFAFADLVIHSLFNTSPSDPLINNASSYLDLSPLYGSSEKEVDSVRRKDGTGRLWNDVFADRRLLFMPPAACALLVLLCRNHNYVAEKIMSINEQGTFKAPSSLDEKARLAQDEEIFQRTRLVNCGFFMQAILDDYVGAILGLSRDGYSWRLPVREAVRGLNHEISPRGEGNVVSVEFNLMYRWHSTLSEQDTKWVEEKFHGLFPGKDLGQLTGQDFKGLYRNLGELGDVKTWSFGNLKRSPTGRFDNASLARILQDATESRASAYKARGVPEALRVVEIMGMEHARNWGTCSLNQFRTFMGLKPYSSFAEWNPDPSVHTAAEALYHDIENLELYVGLQAEEAKNPGPGAGLCPGYTMSRAILADAVCLTRGDRFMTIEMTPQNLTAWGYEDCQFDMEDKSYGGRGMLTKLLFRTLPGFYPSNSAYAHFPFLVPKYMETAMSEKDINAVKEYQWTRPGLNPKPTLIGHDNPSQVYEERLSAVTGYKEQPVLGLFDKLLEQRNLQSMCDRIATITDDLMQAKCFLSGSAKCVDIVNNVINVAIVRWVAEQLSTRDEVLGGYPYDDWSTPELRNLFCELAQYVYVNISPENEFTLKKKALDASHRLASYIRDELEEGILHRTLPGLLKLQEPECPNECIIAATVGNIAAIAPIFTRAVVSVLDRLLEEPQFTARNQGKEPHLDEYVRRAMSDTNHMVVGHGLMSGKFFVGMSSAILKTILRYPGLGRAPGKSGELKSFTDDSHASLTYTMFYVDPQAHISPWPTSLLLQYS